MPSIALDDLPIPETRNPDKPDTNVVMLDSSSPSTSEVTNDENRAKLEKTSNNCKNIWLPLIGLLVVIIFFVPLVGLLEATHYHCQKYPDVLVTPFPDYDFNSTGQVTIPCYYPVLNENFTGVDIVLCNNVQYPADYYCPKDYTCLIDAQVFPAPYVGCVSLTTSCGDLTTCVDEIASLPNVSGSKLAKTFSLTDYSKLIINVFVLGGIFLLFITGFLMIVNAFYRNRTKNFSKRLAKLVWLLLIVCFVFIMISGGFYFSIDIPASGNCYADADLNYTLHKLSALSIGYLEVFIFTGVAAILFFYIGFLILLSFYGKLRKLRTQDSGIA